MVDSNFTKKIQDWLYTEPKTDDMAISGALLLQQINPRNLMYRRWISLAASRPSYIIEKIEYELKKQLKYRLNGLTLEQVRRLDQRVVPEAEKIITEGVPENTAGAVHDENPDEVKEDKTLGKRPDHDKLPDEIKQIWVENGELYKQIKAVFEELKSMENLPSCDRYDKLQVLQSLDEKYLKQMERYDNYEIGTDYENSPQVAIGTARSYLSKNLQKLQELKAQAESADATDQDKSAFQALLEKMQQRLDIIISANAPITDELKASYQAVGLKTEPHENTDDTEGTEASE